jgi:hypothetical protein
MIKPKHFVAAALTIMPMCAMAKVYTPNDINYLATLESNNKAYFETNVMGVDQFAGQGVVREVGAVPDPDRVVVDTRQGDVSCLMSNPAIHVGDRVFVTGSVGGTTTAAKISEMNEFFKNIPGHAKPFPVVDVLGLLTGSCAIRQVQ